MWLKYVESLAHKYHKYSATIMQLYKKIVAKNVHLAHRFHKCSATIIQLFKKIEAKMLNLWLINLCILILAEKQGHGKL